MSNQHFWRRRGVLLAGLGLAGASLQSIARQGKQMSQSAGQQLETVSMRRSISRDQPLRIGWSPWADAEVVSLMAASLIQQRLNVPVERC